MSASGRVWRCSFCETVNSPSSPSCRACELPRGGGSGGGGSSAAHNPSESNYDWFDGTYWKPFDAETNMQLQQIGAAGKTMGSVTHSGVKFEVDTSRGTYKNSRNGAVWNIRRSTLAPASAAASAPAATFSPAVAASPFPQTTNIISPTSGQEGIPGIQWPTSGGGGAAGAAAGASTSATSASLMALPAGIDPAWFVELPKDVQSEVLAQHSAAAAAKRQKPSAVSSPPAAAAGQRRSPTGPTGKPHLGSGAGAGAGAAAAAWAAGAGAAPAGMPLRPKRMESVMTRQLADRSAAAERLQTITEQCSALREQFVDPDFPPTPVSLHGPGGGKGGSRGFGGGSEAVQWLRPKDIRARELGQGAISLFGALFGGQFAQSTAWRLWDQPGPADVSQGFLGNCWFLSAVAAIAERKTLLENLFVTEDTSALGVYQIRLCINGEWKVFTIDDTLPCTGRGTLAYSDGLRGQLWVPLLEKAMAKANQSYAQLTAGRLNEALEILTGMPTERMEIGSSRTGRSGGGGGSSSGGGGIAKPQRQGSGKEEPVDYDVLWAQLLSSREAGFLLGASCGKDEIANEVFESVGLVQDHAYSILDTQLLETRNGAVQLVLLRNPWGRRSWRGAWSETSSDWTPELLRIVAKGEGAHNRGTSTGGKFWMSFADFVMYFDSVTICRVRSGWAEARARVTVPSVRGGMKFAAAQMKPIAAGEVDIVITQPRTRGGGVHKTFLDPGFIVVRQDHGNKLTPVATAKCNNRASVTTSCFLQPAGGGGGGGAAGGGGVAGGGSGTYLIVPFSLRAASPLSSDGRVMVTAVHSSSPIVVDEVELTGEQFGLAIAAEARRAGKIEISAAHLGVTVYRLSFASGYIFIATNTGILGANIELTVQSQNMMCSRDSMALKDTVYPGRGQILGIVSQASESVGYSISYRFSIGGAIPFMPAVHTPPLPDNSIHSPFPVHR